VLLAAKTRSEFNAWMKGRELPRLTAHTIVDLARFRELIEVVRQRDWCISSEEHELGVHALAVPLRNMQGQTVAALNVIATQRLTPRGIESSLLPMLMESARELRGLL
jgi:IclR family transcriptional regulator, pca regulon regulatory protein